MGHSRKRAPILQASRSAKSYKQMAHRQMRRKEREILRATGSDETVPHPKAYGNPWRSPKDGYISYFDVPPSARPVGLTRK